MGHGQANKPLKPKGNTKAMLGKVFQLASKTDNKQQFVYTMDMLKQVMLRKYKGQITWSPFLQTLFKTQ